MEKKQAISLLCSRDIFGLKILQSDWPRPIWPNMTEKKTNRSTDPYSLFKICYHFVFCNFSFPDTFSNYLVSGS